MALTRKMSVMAETSRIFLKQTALAPLNVKHLGSSDQASSLKPFFLPGKRDNSICHLLESKKQANAVKQRIVARRFNQRVAAPRWHSSMNFPSTSMSVLLCIFVYGSNLHASLQV